MGPPEDTLKRRKIIHEEEREKAFLRWLQFPTTSAPPYSGLAHTQAWGVPGRTGQSRRGWKQIPGSEDLTYCLRAVLWTHVPPQPTPPSQI